MSRQLINLSPDLLALVDDGYELDIVEGYLVIYNVPYVNAQREVRRGTLISELGDVAGDKIRNPNTHVALFAGEYPCDRNGNKLEKIVNSVKRKVLSNELVADFSFSSKPCGADGYDNFYEKMATYIAILSTHAQAIEPSATAQTRRIIETSDEGAVFKYVDTASSRAGITMLNDRIELGKVAIVGLGGTGSYVLDLMVKSPVGEIHLFDGDDFLQHNAFRSPGAASIEELKSIPKKVDYYAHRYQPMRHGIVAHDFHIDTTNVGLLEDMDFVFICVDRGDVKQPIVEKLEALDISFIDVGMGLVLANDKLQGIIRVTASTPEMRNHVRDKKRIAFHGGAVDDAYTQNIQIPELNALNATLAVIKWKKIYGYYADIDKEHFITYTLEDNKISNEDIAP